MGDSCPISFVFCHAHGAQIPEFSRLVVPGRLYRTLGGGDKKAGRVFLPPAIVHWPLKGQHFVRFSLAAMKRFLKNSHRPLRD
jgi:hypothetical protein